MTKYILLWTRAMQSPQWSSGLTLSDAAHITLRGAVILSCGTYNNNYRTSADDLVKMRLSDLVWACLGSDGLYATAWSFDHNGHSTGETEAWSQRSYFFVGGQYVQTTLVCNSLDLSSSDESANKLCGRRTITQQLT